MLANGADALHVARVIELRRVGIEARGLEELSQPLGQHEAIVRVEILDIGMERPDLVAEGERVAGEDEAGCGRGRRESIRPRGRGAPGGAQHDGEQDERDTGYEGNRRRGPTDIHADSHGKGWDEPTSSIAVLFSGRLWR